MTGARSVGDKAVDEGAATWDETQQEGQPVFETAPRLPEGQSQALAVQRSWWSHPTSLRNDEGAPYHTSTIVGPPHHQDSFLQDVETEIEFYFMGKALQSATCDKLPLLLRDAKAPPLPLALPLLDDKLTPNFSDPAPLSSSSASSRIRPMVEATSSAWHELSQGYQGLSGLLLST